MFPGSATAWKGWSPWFTVRDRRRNKVCTLPGFGPFLTGGDFTPAAAGSWSAPDTAYAATPGEVYRRFCLRKNDVPALRLDGGRDVVIAAVANESLSFPSASSPPSGCWFRLRWRSGLHGPVFDSRPFLRSAPGR